MMDTKGVSTLKVNKILVGAVMTAVFALLKAFGIVPWAWGWVLAPLAAGLVLELFLPVCAIVLLGAALLFVIVAQMVEEWGR